MDDIITKLTIDFQTLYVSIITGVISSAVFLFILSRLKPKVIISNEVAERVGSGSSTFIFKILNKSCFFKVYDVSIRVYSTKIIPSINGDDIERIEISVRKDYQRVIDRFNPRHYWQNSILGKKRLRSHTNYAAQFSTTVNLNDIIAQGRTVEMEVYAKHSLTGFSKIFSVEYKHANNIVKGSFRSGNSFIIE
ncbi:MAG: hypothetical protein QHC79_09465 [Pseudosphingobacterium sp.]|nr:hypothetical protein [Pseudosphingobacterium sp.]